MKYLLFLIVVFFFSAVVSFSQDTIHVPADYSTIQAGINAANNGDIVLVAEGTYYENVVIVNKAITVASHFIVDSLESHIENTIIDGSQPSNTDSGSVIMIFNSAEPITICGFTLTGGSGKKTIWPGGSFSIAGAGVYIDHASAEIMNNHIIDNSITSPIQTEGTFGGGVMWGTINVSGLTLKMFDNLISNNVISGLMTGGGGVSIINYYIGGEFNYLIEDNIIENNTVINTDEWKAMGGGIFLDFGLPTVGDQIIRNNIIRNNSVNCTHSFGGGLYFIIRDTLVTGEVDNDPGPYIYNNKIYENHSDYLGAGVSVWRAYYKVGHQAEPLQSAGNYVPKPSFINNTIVDNTAQDGSGFYIMNHVPFLMNNIIRNNYPGNAEWGEVFMGNVPYWMEPNHYQGVMMFYNNIQEGWEDGDSAAGNIDYDPLFSDTLFHLSDLSPCIGAGIDYKEIGSTGYNCPPYDFYGNPRPNPSGSMPDIGACESPLDHPVAVENALSQTPATYSLQQNYPNPFNPQTTIQLELPTDGYVSLKIYSVLGQEVATLVSDNLSAGSYNYIWNASNFASGIYVYRLEANGIVLDKKMILMK